MRLSETPKKLGLILASFDSVAVDPVRRRLPSHDPARIECFKLPQVVLGDMESIQLVEGEREQPASVGPERDQRSPRIRMPSVTHSTHLFR